MKKKETIHDEVKQTTQAVIAPGISNRDSRSSE